MNHVDIETLVAFARGEASPDIEAHVRACAKCKDLAAVVGLQLEPPRIESTSNQERYEDIQLYGKGGMGEVYLAKDRRLQRQVVLKMPPRATDSVRHLKLAARLEHERSVLARLNHPAIPPVLEGGQFGADREPFFAMPIAGVETLTKAVDRLMPLKARMALLPSLISVAEGVAYAHRKGVIHRDIKPDHVLLGVDGEARLIDWGLAKVSDEAKLVDDLRVEAPVAEAQRGDLLATVQGLYTEGYSPPEQRQNAAAQPHFDVYALGATLFFLLTGRHPTSPHPPRSSFPPRCPHDLVKIVQKAMHVRPDERYADAGELAQVLKTFQAGRLVHPTLPQLIEDWIRRRAVTVILVAALIGLVAVVFNRASHRGALRQARTRYQGMLTAVEKDAEASIQAHRQLEAMYAQLSGDFEKLELTATATITKLSQRLLAIRRQQAKLNRLVADHRDARSRLEFEWTATQSKLGRVNEQVRDLQHRLTRSNTQAQAARVQLGDREADLRLTQQQLAQAQRRIEALEKALTESHQDRRSTLRLRHDRRSVRRFNTNAEPGMERPKGPFGYHELLPELGPGPGSSASQRR